MILVIDNRSYLVLSTWKSKNQCRQQPSLIFFRIKKKFPLKLLQLFDVKANDNQVHILISAMIILPWELYFCTTFPFVKVQTFFFFHSVMPDSKDGTNILIWGNLKFQISVVHGEVCRPSDKMCNSNYNVWFCVVEFFIKWHFTKTWKKSNWAQQESNLWSLDCLLKWSAFEISEIY